MYASFRFGLVWFASLHFILLDFICKWAKASASLYKTMFKNGTWLRNAWFGQMSKSVYDDRFTACSKGKFHIVVSHNSVVHFLSFIVKWFTVRPNLENGLSNEWMNRIELTWRWQVYLWFLFGLASTTEMRHIDMCNWTKLYLCCCCCIFNECISFDCVSVKCYRARDKVKAIELVPNDDKWQCSQTIEWQSHKFSEFISNSK